jgi:hypothetical protein
VIFKKQELSFLEFYTICSDSKNILHDKLIITASKKDKKIIFAQLSYDVSLYTELERDDIEEDFSLIYDVNIFYSVLKLTPNDENIYIDKEKIKFGKNSTYDFKKYDIDFSMIDKFKNNIEVEEKIHIKSLDRLSALKSFVGQDSFDLFQLYNKYFIASNSTDITGAVLTENDITANFIIPRIIYSIINSIKVSDVIFDKLNKEGELLFRMKIDKTNIYFLEKESKIQNIFEDEIRNLYYHNAKVIVSKKELILALQRISITTSQNIYNRISLLFKDKKCYIINNEIGYSEEIISASIDKEIENTQVNVSSSYLRMIVELLNTDNISILVSNDTEAVAITLEDENKDRFFIHNLYENVG